MIDYAGLLADLRLYRELENSAGRDGLSATDVKQLVGMVNHAAAVAGPLLELIPQTFKQYTSHNIGHCRNLIDLMGRFIPEETLGRLNGLELAVLMLSALLHDFGMFVREEERRALLKRETLTSVEFESFTAGHHARAAAVEEARRAGEHERAEIIQDSLLADYFRRMHPQRARDNVQANLEGKLVFRDVDLSPHVLDVCESHAWGVYESNDPLRPEKTVAQLSTNSAVYGSRLNLQYIACCLRLADIMDFDRSRTPLVVFQNINFTDEKSWEEWNKHLSVGGWVINEREVLFRIPCTHPSFYVAVMEFLDWVDAELGECRRLLVKDAPTGVAEHYRLHLPPVVDRWEVAMADKSYLAGAFRFQLEYERIMQLLMDKSLYPDPSLFLRELLQNALDACRNKEALAREYEFTGYSPRIAVWDFSGDPETPRVVFQDNGVGMSRKIVENYFMRVGRSYYRSPEFDAERARLKRKGIELEATSQFGIGILSCFMVADRFEVETYRVDDRPLHITIEGPTKYFVIKLLDPPTPTPFPLKPASDADDGPPRHTGTRVTVHLRPGTTLDVFQTLDTFAANVDYDLALYRPADPDPRVIPARRWESEDVQRATLPMSLDERVHEYSTTLPGVRNLLSSSEMARHLGGVLMPSRVPFERYDFSSHLRGAAWFWLLKDEEGRPCPARGYLSLIGSLSVEGAPGVAGFVMGNLKTALSSDEWKSFLKMLRARADGDELMTGDDDALEILGPVFRQEGSRSWEKAEFIRRWDELAIEERRAVADSLGLLHEKASPWVYVPGIPDELLLETPGWSKQALRLHTNVAFNDSPRSLSLHGIHLPAGFVEWDPMAGSSERLSLLDDIPSGILVDMRGAGVPTPAANRLFVLSEESKKGALPLLRACLHHAVELASSGQEDQGWQTWLNFFIVQMSANYYWIDVLNIEYDLLTPILRYTATLKGEKSPLTSAQLTESFGDWVPVSGYWSNREGIALYSGRMHIPLVFRERRRQEDGTLEVNMTSKVNVPYERMREAVEELEADLAAAGIDLDL